MGPLLLPLKYKTGNAHQISWCYFKPTDQQRDIFGLLLLLLLVLLLVLLLLLCYTESCT
jgi:hypothetical protein